ncbi:MAG: AAA family ATPase [Candidatus Omnitrophota bacterium]
MGQIIAMAGKGGVGKTTIAGLLVRLIKEKKLGSILAVDADANSNLGESLGVEVKEDLGRILDDIGINPGIVPVNMGKDAFIEYRAHSAIIEAGGFDLLAMGKPEGPGCYCYLNNALRNVMDKLVKGYDFVIIDNEAGLEHLSRRTSRQVDVMLVVTDPSAAGLRSAKRISGLTKELNIKAAKEFLIVNRSSGNIRPDILEGLRLECLGFLPIDPEIDNLSRQGASLMNLGDDNLTLNALGKLGEKIWLCN